jgi:hypothetical protein
MNTYAKIALIACCITLVASIASVTYSAKPGQGGCPSLQLQADWHQDNVDEYFRCLQDSPGDFCGRQYLRHEEEDARLIAMLCS